MHIPKDSAHDLLEESLNQTRRMAVEQALKQFGENKAAAARALGVSRPKLYRIIAELGLD
jgi:DNA-binding NtrC family response regulator